jgi:hypothetical protein
VEVCLNDDALIALTFSPPFDASFSIQWEASINGGAFTMLTDGAAYNGTQTPDLTVFDVTSTFQTNRYRAIIERVGNS